jgi:O-antigen/teichoic acid export membrane protein
VRKGPPIPPAGVDDRGSAAEDILATRLAGPKAIRGGMLRTIGYGAGLLLSLASAPLLLRHLGVVDFGGYVSVQSLVAIVGLIADAGLTVVAVREFSTRDAPGQRRLIENVASLRALISIVGALGAVGFAVIAGYDSALVLGTSVAGVGLILAIGQQTYTVPLAAELRLGAITALELLRQALTVAGILLLIALSATVTAFLAVSVPVGVVVAVATFVVVRRTVSVKPRIDLSEWRYLLRQALPVAAASILAALFYRLAIILTSVLSTPEQTGYFGASLRVIEVIIPIPSLITSAAFPILSRAAEDAGDRLAYALDRLFEIGLILGGYAVVVLVLGAGPLIDFIGGSKFEPAVPVLRVQGLAVAATFLFAVWAAGLWAIQAQRSLLHATIVGVTAVIGLTAALAPAKGAIGAAIGMTISEFLLAATAGFFLMRAREDLRASLVVVPKVLAAMAAAGALWWLGLPPVVLVVLASLVYLGLLLLLRAIPVDVWHALRDRKRGEPA